MRTYEVTMCYSKPPWYAVRVSANGAAQARRIAAAMSEQEGWGKPRRFEVREETGEAT